ncbi:MAG: HAMP domain-containing protein, partial [Anaerolineae bacterium]|nr:HAMP domain-containing protein [Anaerolineae bacterium]
MTALRPRRQTYFPRVFLAIHPLWALAEMWVLGLLLLFVLFRLTGAIPRAALSNGTLLLCAACGLWVVFRARLSQHAWWKQGLWELATGVAVSLVMAVGLGLPARWLGWDAIWRVTMGTGTASLIRSMTGVGYLIARVGVRLWVFWNRLRRRRMLWAITHAHLITVLVVMVIVYSVLMLSVLLFPNATPSEAAAPAVSFATRLLHTIFPAVSVMVVFTFLGLAVVMPPSAVFSFFVARRTTHRLEKLAKAAKSWRAGDYEARVEVMGEDEVAQLQADLNAMAGELARTMSDLETERDTVTQLLESRRELVVNVSHELRTPVATMRAMLESTLAHWQDDPPPTLQHDLEAMQGEVERLQRLIDDLFTLSQTEI